MILVAIALAFAQMVAAGHFHHVDSTRRCVGQSGMALDGGQCPLCAFAWHAPVKPAAIPTLERPIVALRLTPIASARRVFGAPFSSWRTRAPPRLPL